MSENIVNKIVQQLKDPEAAKPWDLLNPTEEKVDKETQKNRYILCLKCPSLIKETKICKECGCFMKLKTRLQKASCPLGKW